MANPAYPTFLVQVRDRTYFGGRPEMQLIAPVYWYEVQAPDAAAAVDRLRGRFPREYAVLRVARVETLP